MTPEMEATILAQLDLFREKFGREAGPGDPIFFDPDFDVPTPLTDEVAQAPSVRAGLATSPRPRIGGWSIRASRVSSQRHPRVR